MTDVQDSAKDHKQNRATNVHWHEGQVDRDARRRLLRQRGATLWFTGLSGSGKSTVAVALEQRLFAEGRLVYRLDGDNIRMGINRNLGFSADDREENIRRVGEVSKLFADAGLVVLSSFISPYQKDRQLCRELHREAGLPFFEIYMACPLEVAEQRDPKGLYKKARAGEIPNFTGISDPYEEPEQAELVIDSSKHTLEEEVAMLCDLLEREGVFVELESASQGGGAS